MVGVCKSFTICTYCKGAKVMFTKNQRTLIKQTSFLSFRGFWQITMPCQYTHPQIDLSLSFQCCSGRATKAHSWQHVHMLLLYYNTALNSKQSQPKIEQIALPFLYYNRRPTLVSRTSSSSMFSNTSSYIRPCHIR